MKILVILPRFPFPLEKGDKLRAYHQIKYLSQRHEIYLFALSHIHVSDEAIAEMQQYCKSVRIAHLSPLGGAMRVMRNFCCIQSLQMGYWDSASARSQLRRYADEVQPDVVYAQMVRTMKYAAALPYRKVLDFQDALSMNTERRMTGRHGLRYFVLHYEFKMLRSAEYSACNVFDAMTIISETDRDAIPQHYSTRIDVVRNGVDFAYFRPMPQEQHYDLVFCGNMSYAPNINAARYLVEEIMPLVWQRYPEANVLLAGADPKPAVRTLASSRVAVSGRLPDIRSAYADARIFVAPMRIGSGLQNKLLEAMAMQLPCVTTSLANAALGATDGEHLLVGDNAEAIANHIIQLLGDDALRSRIAESGRQYVQEHYSWPAAIEPLEKIFNELVSK